MNDFVRYQFTSHQDGEIKFWQEMIGGGAAGASQVVSVTENKKAMQRELTEE